MRNIYKSINFSKIKQFADDIVIYKSIYVKNDTKLLQNDLINVFNWSTNNKLKLNPSKSIHLRITTKRLIDLNTYNMDNTDIPLVTEHKHLGVILDNKLSFNENVNYIHKNCIRKWTSLKRIFNLADYKTLLKLYKTYYANNRVL